MAVQAQWSLDATSASVLSVSQDLVRALTTDNVQPMALLACERFGATLAISPDTCHKVELSVLPPASTRSIHFLKSLAGYSRDDSATFLGRSLAGMQFLALAAALATSLEPSTAATVLHSMLKTTAADASLIPPLGQITRLLKAMEHRLVRSGFCNNIVGWELALFGSENSSTYTHRPSPKAIEGLMDALRKLTKPSETAVSNVTINVCRSAPWVIAFLTWCLGRPPAVILPGRLVAANSGGQGVTVVVDEASTERDISISMNYAIGSPEDLVYREVPHRWSGMVTIEAYGNVLLRRHGLDKPELFSVIHECMPYIAKFSIENPNSRESGVFPPGSPNRTAIRWNGISPFPDHYQVENVLSKILGVDCVFFSKLNSGQRIYELRATAKYLSDHQCTTSCPICPLYPQNDIGGGIPSQSCKIYTLFLDLAYLLKNILGISLLYSPEDAPLLWTPATDIRPGQPRDEPFVTFVRRCFQKQPIYAMSHSFDLIETALSVTGADSYRALRPSDGQEWPDRWLMSSFKGQVIYPFIFEHFNLESNGYLSLCCVPGQLKFEGTDYHLAMSSAPWLMTDEAHIPPNPSLMQTTWKVSPKEDFLAVELELSVRKTPAGSSINPKSTSMRGLIDPRFSLLAMSRAIRSPRCGHARDATTGAHASRISNIPPWTTYHKDRNATYSVATDGAKNLRFFALGASMIFPCDSSNTPTEEVVAPDTIIIRTDTCLACCIDYLRSEPGLKVII